MENIRKQKQESAASIFHNLLDTLENRDILTIRQFRTSLEGVVPNETLEELVKDLDKNGDGLVDRGEFVDLFLNSQKFASLMKAKEAAQHGEDQEDISTTVFLR